MKGNDGVTERLNSCLGSTSRVLLVALLVLHTALIAWLDAKNSPNPDETAHMAAGAAIWRSDRLDLYAVNPPFVRALATLPIVYGCPDADWSSLQDERHDNTGITRPEWSLGIGLVRDNPDRAMWFFVLARWACIPLSLIGGYFCWRWAGEMYGSCAAALALVLWCFSPNVIAWSATICPDVAAASLGIAACYFFWRWLKEPEWFFALLAGVALGLAELTKMTWVVLFAVWPLIWLIWFWGRRHRQQLSWHMKCAFYRQALQLASIVAIGVLVLNLGYGLTGTCTRLGDFTFVSHALADADSIAEGGKGGNCFAESWLRYLPVPLPRDYVRGIDLQKVDFERGLPSYLFGQWSQHGWWYYYVVCAVLKVPLGIWAIGLLAVGMRLGRLKTIAKGQPEVKPPGYRADWLDEIVLLLPAIVLIVFVSSQTGFSRHFRYVLPAFPFLFVWIGSVAQKALQKPWSIGVCVAGSLTWAVVSSLAIYPHSMSYFNEVAGGPMGGPRYLLDANIDWGQDVLYLKDWCTEHPEATPLHVAFGNSYSDTLLGLGDRVRNLDILKFNSQGESAERDNLKELGPMPGWYAMSVHRIHNPKDGYEYFRHFTPVATAGYSIYIYHVAPEEASSVRKELGLPDISADEVAEL